MYEVTRITCEDGNTYWIDGHDSEEPYVMFGDVVKLEFLWAVDAKNAVTDDAYLGGGWLQILNGQAVHVQPHKIKVMP